MAQTVLVVEDEVLVRIDIADHLEGCGYVVLERSNATDAIALLRARHDIDVVFTDVFMPGPMDGMALARWIMQNRQEIAVIIASGYAAQDAAMRSLCGANVFRKPYVPAAVSAKIRELLAHRNPS